MAKPTHAAAAILNSKIAAPGLRVALICHHMKMPDRLQKSMMPAMMSTTTAQAVRTPVSPG